MGLLSSNGALFNKVLHPVMRGMRDATGLFLPRHCAGCDEALMRHEHAICTICAEDLPRTRFHDDPANAVERAFWGRVELSSATALLYFDKRGKVQHLLHQLKYKGDRETGLELGRRLGLELKVADRFRTVEEVLSVPLHRRKERERGFNQSEVLAEGIREAMGILPGTCRLERTVHTASQTRKGRHDRWLNVKDAFLLSGPGSLEGRHVLLVDDVVTTGATLEGCVIALQKVPGVRVSVATVAFA